MGRTTANLSGSGQARQWPRVLQRRMSVAPRKRQLATEERRVVKGQKETFSGRSKHRELDH